MRREDMKTGNHKSRLTDQFFLHRYAEEFFVEMKCTPGQRGLFGYGPFSRDHKQTQLQQQYLR